MRPLLKGLSLIFIILCSQLCLAQSPIAAACVIKADDQLLMVRDSINKRLSLPGGGIEKGETAEQAAIRETVEETGVEAKIVSFYQDWGPVVLYHCESLEPIKANQKKSDESKVIRIYGYGAKHIGTEIRHAYLVDIHAMKKEMLRFPFQLTDLRQAFTRHQHPSQVRYLEDNLEAAHGFHRKELALIHQFQQAMGESTRPLFRVLNEFGEPKLYYLLLPLIWICLGWKIGARLTLLLLFGFCINHLLKISFSLPRPFDYMPALQSMRISGFGLPSGHTTTATLFWGFLYLYMMEPRFPRYRIPFLLLTGVLIAGTALSRLYFGVHFISDVCAGFLSACLILLVFRMLDVKVHFFDSWLEGEMLPWACYLGILFLLTGATFSLSFAMIFSSSFGLLLGIRTGAAKRHEPWIRTSVLSQSVFVIVSVAGCAAITSVMSILRELVYINSQIVVLTAVKYCALGFWLSCVNYQMMTLLLGRNQHDQPGGNHATSSES